MPMHASAIPASRIVVIMPNWLGDGVMATPFLRALRSLYPDAHIAAVTRPLVAPVLAGLSCINDTFITKKGEESQAHSWLKQNHFDLGISLPNSFRAAWLLWRGGVKRRLGYAREYRGCLLTDRIRPILRTAEQCDLDTRKAAAITAVSRELKHPATASVGSKFQPVSTIEYYLKLAEYLGAPADADKHMQLAITDAERTEADAILNSELGILNSRFVVFVPGANFGSSKCWPPERFAEVARRLITERHVHVLLASSPAELPIIEAILHHAFQNPELRIQNSLHALAKLNGGKGVSLGALKDIVRRSTLMLCNDTGPRHFAAAFDIPCVTLFGPTDPVWAETWHPKEKIVRIDVPCGPCQLKKCPIDHRCMNGIDVDMVIQAVASLWPSE